ncbi:hypothetical protein MATL_G00209060 [Megalops atlanticus]|uniref:Uncharacterized protein n=1 Tax=Megalops atlanticus TaxID=7932 RepID=A0A9D3PIT8_MEGAT|nr:hypothetical protein MATL_G00209060 [Megalops atlanticus]
MHFPCCRLGRIPHHYFLQGPDRTLSNINQRTLKYTELPCPMMVLQLSMPHSFFQPLSGQGESTLAGR